MSPIAHHYLRELRLIAFAQYLVSYRTVQLSMMAQAFGISEEFLIRELEALITNGRLACRIDAVSRNVVVTHSGQLSQTLRHQTIDGATSLMSKQQQYQAVLKSGDAVLARLQKLVKAATS